MKKPTDEELLRISVDAHDSAELTGVRGLSLQVSGERACYEHGWRECIEALRVHMTEDGSGVIFDADDAAGYLEQLSKERGHR